MKWIIRFGIPVITFALCVFGDVSLYNYLITLLPNTEWTWVIKLVLFFVLLYVTVGLVVGAIVMSAILAFVATEDS